MRVRIPLQSPPISIFFECAYRWEHRNLTFISDKHTAIHGGGIYQKAHWRYSVIVVVKVLVKLL
ncbi:hypothetical protein D1104_02705 [Actinobacillus pleuropneumoniae serovar 11 str. 56153]|nr:hypothetical protein APPSER1_02660 [Actinobacillus pleuropneumoniae serovar 1 str. 4074]UKH30305.1 hypothetical protein D1104_02705 [Actinobacillus pleuropneumoniae serovar 11 str. 56153]